MMLEGANHWSCAMHSTDGTMLVRASWLWKRKEKKRKDYTLRREI